MTGGPLVWTYTWDTPTGDEGPITVSISALDNAGNANAAATGQTSFVVDNTAPRITTIIRQNPTNLLTNANVLVWDVTFNETVLNVGTNDFAVTGTTGTITSVVDQGSNVYRVTVSGGDLANLNATVTLSVAASPTITDSVENAFTNPAPTTTNNNTFDVENIQPTVVLSSTDADGRVRSGQANVTITATFTEANGLNGTPTISIPTTATPVSGAAMTGGPLIWTYSWDTPTGNEGPITVSISAVDNAGNTNTAATGQTTFIIDNTQPTVALTDDQTNNFVRNGESVLFTATFTEANVIDETAGVIPRITLSGASGVSNVAMTKTDNLVWTYIWAVPAGNFTSNVSIAAADLAGNTNTAVTGARLSFIVDNTPPVVATISANSPLKGIGTTQGIVATSVDFLVTFTDANTPLAGIDVNGADFTVLKDATVGFTSLTVANTSATTRTVTVNGITGTGRISLGLTDDDTILDAAGNPLGGVGTSGAGNGSLAATYSGTQYYNIVLAEPTNPVAALTAPTILANSITVQWNQPVAGAQAATHYLVMGRPTSGSYPSTVVDAAFVSNGAFAQNIVKGAGIQTATFSGLNSGTSYDFIIYPYTLGANNTNDNIDFKTTSAATVTAVTITASSSTITLNTGGTTILSTVNASPGQDAIKFTIQDDGVSPGDDNAPFKFSSIKFNAGGSNTITKWTEILGSGAGNALLYVGGTPISATVNITDTDITFSGIASTVSTDPGFISDNGSKQYTLKVWLKTNLAGSQNYPFNIDGLAFDFNVNGSATNIGYNDGSGVVSSRSTTIIESGVNTVNVLATLLAITTQPQASIGVGTNFNQNVAITKPVFEARDANGNRDKGYAGTLTVTNTAGFTQTPATFTGTATSGIFTINNYAINTNGTPNGSATTKIQLAGTGGVTSVQTNDITVAYTNLSRITLGAAAPLTISSLSNTLGGAVQNFEFTIQDDAGANATTFADNDAIDTKLNKIVITRDTGNDDVGDWTKAIAGAELSDNFSNVQQLTPATDIVANSLTFNINPATLGLIADGTTKTYKLKIWLKSTIDATIVDLIDNSDFVFNVSQADVFPTTISSTLQSSSANSGNANNKVDVVATKLKFTTNPPASLLPNKNINLQPDATAIPIVRAQDANGNTDRNYSLGLTIAAGVTTNPTALASSDAVSPNAGIYTFPGTFRYTQVGSGTLTVSPVSGSVTSGVSTAVIVQAGAASTITAGTGIGGGPAPATISSLDNVTAVPVFNFVINDDPIGTPAAQDDGNPTLITKITVTQKNNNAALADWTQAIATATLSDGVNTPLAASAINPTSIVFDLSSLISSGQLGFIDNDLSKSYTLSITLKASLLGSLPTVIDGKNFGFEVINSGTNITTSAAGTSILSGQNTNSGTSTNTVTVVASKLDYTSLPAPLNTLLNVNFQPIVVEARDANNNRDLDFTGQLTGFSNADGLTMNNPPIANSPSYTFTQPSAGVFTFPNNFQFTSTPASLSTTLTVTAGSLTKVSPSIGVTASTSSKITYVPSASSGKIPYISFQSASIADTTTSFRLAKYILTDGPDTDGAPTNIKSIQFKITTTDDANNTVNGSKEIRQIALFNAAGLKLSEVTLAAASTVTFSVNDLSPLPGTELQAPDNGSTFFTVRATFKNDSLNVRDLDNIRLQIQNVTQGPQSEFNPGAANSITGGAWTRATGAVSATAVVTPTTKNVVNVVATKLVFTRSTPSYAGVSQPVPFPLSGISAQIKALDNNNIRDLEFDKVRSGTKGTLSSAGAPLGSSTFDFKEGNLNLHNSQFTYTGTGLGTITVSATIGLPSGASPPSTTTSGRIDVVNVVGTALGLGQGGIVTSVNLAGSSVNKVIYGVKFNAPYKPSINTEPFLKGFTIRFTNRAAGVLQNFKVFESDNGSFTGSRDVTNTTGTNPAAATLKFGTKNSSDSLAITFGNPRDFTLNTVDPGNYTYFLVVDVASTANGSTPTVQPYVKDAGFSDPASNGDVFVSNGSSYSDAQGPTYAFAAIVPPLLVSSYPASGQTNVDPNQTSIDLVFSVPVWTLDTKIKLFKLNPTTGVSTFVLDLLAANGKYNRPGATPAVASEPLAGTTLAPLRFTIPASTLTANTVYYVTIASGELVSNSSFVNKGIMDQSGNLFAGITFSGTLFFKTADPSPPSLLTFISGTNDDVTPTQVVDISSTGATIRATFDKKGKAYFLVLKNPSTPPTKAQIKTPGTYPTPSDTVRSGSFLINQIRPAAQFGTFNAALSASTTYNVWMYSENDALPTPVETSAPYGAGSAFAVGGVGPTISFTTPTSFNTTIAFNNPSISICSNSYQTIYTPITIREGNTGEFTAAGSQTLNLLLPTGFQFDTNTPGILKLDGSDFSGPGSLSFINSSILKVTFTNTSSSSLDRISLSGFRIISTGTVSGAIKRFGGSLSFTLIPDETSLASISSFDAPTIQFSNEYSRNVFGNDQITTIPDNYNKTTTRSVELIPLPPLGDFGPSSFSGPGVNINQLSLSAVTLNNPFDVTITHTDNNGCISKNPVSYTVYDSRTAIRGLETQRCTTNPNFGTPVNGGNAIDSASVKQINYDGLPGYLLYSLKASVPTQATSTSQKIFGPEWATVLKNLISDSTFRFFAGNPDTLKKPKDYRFDDATILNAKFTINGVPNQNIYEYFKATASGNTFYSGGSLGNVDFEAKYQSIANASVQITLKQNVEFFLPAIPIIQVGTSNRSFLDTSVPDKPSSIFCEAGGLITLNGFPAAAGGSSTGAFTLENESDGVVIYAKNFTYNTTDGGADAAGFTRITLTKPLNLKEGDQLDVLGINVSGTKTITSKINSSTYIINLAFAAANTVSAVIVNIALPGIIDNGNGTGSIDPSQTLTKNEYKNILVRYNYKENVSPCSSSSTQIIRVAPNPVAAFVPTSLASFNVDAATPTAYCVSRPIAFDAATSTISDPASTITGFKWDFADPNPTGTNPSLIEGTKGDLAVPGTPSAGLKEKPNHIFIASNKYTVGLKVTSNFGCESPLKENVVSVGAIPSIAFSFEGVSTADDITFTDKTTLVSNPAVVDNLAVTKWNYGDLSSIDAAGKRKYANPGYYKVILERTSAIGCKDTTSRQIVVLGRFTANATSTYDEGFETSNGNWQVYRVVSPSRSYSQTPVAPSWKWGNAANKATIKPGTKNGTNIWVTNNTTGANAGKYSPNEKSALYSLSFDTQGLQRPMISFNSYVRTSDNDGVVLQYSTDNKNVVDPDKVWQVLGDNTGGLNWYNKQNIAAKPGDQATGDVGWSGVDASWQDRKFALVQQGTAVALRSSRIVFRFALASQTTIEEGFGIDNVRLGERTRTILLENFVNAGNSDASEKAAADFVKGFSSSAVGLDVVKLNYHLKLKNDDPFIKDNSTEPSSRAFYYNVDRTPASRLDGSDEPSANGKNRGFDKWGTPEFNKRTLQLAQADIIVRPTTGPAVPPIDSTKFVEKGRVSFFIDVKPTGDLDENTTLHVGILEKNVPLASLTNEQKGLVKSGEQSFEYVLKKFLPTVLGSKTSTHPNAVSGTLKQNQTYTFGPFEWIPDQSLFYEPKLKDLTIAVFLQNDLTKEIYQSEIVDRLNDPIPDPLVTGLESLVPEQVYVYPNPSDQEFTIELPVKLKSDAAVRLIDQVGRTHDAGNFAAGKNAKTVSTEGLASGVYIVEIRAEDGALIRKKVMVVH